MTVYVYYVVTVGIHISVAQRRPVLVWPLIGVPNVTSPCLRHEVNLPY